MELAYFNHASIAIVDKAKRFGFITDPWISSPAFGAWQPHPKLNVTAFNTYLDTLENYALVISHGHDDHCDDSYIKTRLRPSHIFIPKYSSLGFYKRIQRLCSKDASIVELEHGNTYQFGHFRLMATINPDFTSNDAIVAIRDDANTVIHANDNWHTQPDNILKLLYDFSRRSDITYLAQIGIAGSFPLYYLGLDNSEKKSLVIEQLRLQAESIETNSRSLGAVRAYSYANESRFTFLDSTALYSGTLRESILDDYIKKDTIYQGEMANTNDFEHECLNFYNLRNHCSFKEVVKEHKSAIPLLLPNNEVINKLAKLKNQINGYLNESKIDGMVTLSAMSYQDLQSLFHSGDILIKHQEAPVLHLYSTYHTWEEILSGTLNLESITIGGCGLLKKSPSSWNARGVHDALSRFGYRYQSMI
jgi:hypothetical protein